VHQTDTQIEAKATEIAVLNVSIQRKDEEIERLTEQLSETPLPGRDLEQKNVALEEQLRVSLQAEGQMNDIAQKLKTQLDELIKHVDDLEREKVDLMEALATLRARYDKDSGKWQIQQSSIQSLESARNSLSAEKAVLKRQNEELTANSIHMSAQLSKAEEKLADAARTHDQITRLQIQHESQMDDLKQLQAEVQRCRSTHPDEIARLTSEVENLTRELASAHGEIMELKETILEHEKNMVQEDGEKVKCGVGMQVELNNDGFIHVLFINPGGSAFKSGKVIVGDIIHSVDGKPMRTTDDIFQAILGWEGTEVVMEIETTTGWRGEVTLVRKVSPLMMSIGAVAIKAPELDEHHRPQPGQRQNWNNMLQEHTRPEEQRTEKFKQSLQSGVGNWSVENLYAQSGSMPKVPRSVQQSPSAASSVGRRALLHATSMPGDSGARAMERSRGLLGLEDTGSGGGRKEGKGLGDLLN